MASAAAAAVVGPLLVGSSWTTTLEPAVSEQKNSERSVKIHSNRKTHRIIYVTLVSCN